MKNSNGINKKRRNFLKVLAFGGGAIVLGKVLDGSVGNLLAPTKAEAFQNFKVTEEGGKFTVSSKDGQALLVMDNSK